jgi:glucose/arabinose dehydrogenase
VNTRIATIAAGALIATIAVGCGGSNDPAPTPTTAPVASSPAPTVASVASAPEASRVRAVEVARGLTTPWALQFLPDGRMLVTERPGNLRIVTADGKVGAPIPGVPPVVASGHGGLLDLALSPEFATDRQIYFTYATRAADGGMQTALGRATFDESGLTDVRVLFRQEPSGVQDIHFGSRIVFANDGTLWVGLGDRNENQIVQSLGNHYGKIVRLNRDGTVPADNPFVGVPGALPEIWSTGHRNIQGAARDPATGRLWSIEHGPRGGDELNIGVPGANHGWPRISYGRHYDTGLPVGEGTEAPGIEPPRFYWVPTSIAPAGLAFYTGTAVPGWRGSVFLGALQGRALIRLTLSEERVVAEERLLTSLGERIRDVRMGPDGSLYVLAESTGRILRISVD